ncbi:hypothetical protein ACFUEJ_22560 [Gordonia sp. NPDC057258]|uniref:hypothetical protein n=1 Tax=unclassified Gordonia (in: high G+C Gram-positive bacteria) TaxID=2657482 RepID=UPI003628563F
MAYFEGCLIQAGLGRNAITDKRRAKFLEQLSDMLKYDSPRRVVAMIDCAFSDQGLRGRVPDMQLPGGRPRRNNSTNVPITNLGMIRVHRQCITEAIEMAAIRQAEGLPFGWPEPTDETSRTARTLEFPKDPNAGIPRRAQLIEF